MLQTSLDNKKIALELKYLLKVEDSEKNVAMLNTLNKIYPFTMYPLKQVPYFQYFECDTPTTVTKNIHKQLQTNIFIILEGRMTIRKAPHQHNEDRIVDQSIKQKLIFSIDNCQAQMIALENTIYLKIHKIWIQMAKQSTLTQQRNFIRKKLMTIPFFANLSFDQFSRFCSKCFIKILGPQQILLEKEAVPYHLYIIIEGELVYLKNIQFSQNIAMWNDLAYQLQYCDSTSQEMLNNLVRQPKQGDKIMKIKFEIGKIPQGSVICGRQTLTQEKLDYQIVSTLKTRIICIKYPDLYSLNQEHLAEIRTWKPKFPQAKLIRKLYYCDLKWNQYREFIRSEIKLNKINKLTFQDLFRKDMDINQRRYQYCSGQFGEGKIIVSPPAKFAKLKNMATK